jgi:hypothetical protein
VYRVPHGRPDAFHDKIVAGEWRHVADPGTRTLHSHMIPRRLPIVLLILLLSAACSSAPLTKQLGDYTILTPSFTTAAAEKSPSHATVNLAAPAYVAMLFVVPGRGSVIVYPTDSATNNRLEAGAHDVPLSFPSGPMNRDSAIAALRRQGNRRPGNAPPPAQPRPQPGVPQMPSDSAFRDSTRRDAPPTRAPITEPSPSSSPVGYLVVVASPAAMRFGLLKRRIEGVTIPIEDDEALSTVMKLVKSTLPDGAQISAYARELIRQ